MDVDDVAIYAIENAVDPAGQKIEIKQLADLVGLDRSALYDILSRRRHVWAREVERFVRATNSFLIPDAIESHIGRVGVLLPTSTNAHDEVMKRATVLVREFGELLEDLGDASSDGVYTDQEVSVVRQAGAQLFAAIGAVVNQMAAQVRVTKPGGAR